jgi:hypothetical protein
MVSHRPNGEYEEKLDLYARLGVRYYLIYNPEFWQRDCHQPFEVYRLEGQTYRLQIGEPYWMSEVGLGIGRGRQVMGGIEQEVLLWYDPQGQAYPLPDQLIREMQTQLMAERQRAEEAEEKANRLAQRLQELGVDPEEV